jgi:hypothetical protein
MVLRLLCGISRGVKPGELCNAPTLALDVDHRGAVGGHAGGVRQPQPPARSGGTGTRVRGPGRGRARRCVCAVGHERSGVADAGAKCGRRARGSCMAEVLQLAAASLSRPEVHPAGLGRHLFVAMTCAVHAHVALFARPPRTDRFPFLSSPRLAPPSPWYASAPRAPRFAVSLLRLCGPLTPAAAAPPPSHSARKPKHCCAKAA